MWSLILAALRLALGPLILAQNLLENFDANNEGIDDDTAATLKTAINTITAVVSTDTSTGTEARGLVQITTFCTAVLARLDAILALPEITEAHKQEAKNEYDSLFNSSKVFQAKRGKDAEKLADTKQKAAEKLEAIQAS